MLRLLNLQKEGTRQKPYELRNEASREVAKAAVLLMSTSTECKSESVPTDSKKYKSRFGLTVCTFVTAEQGQVFL